MSSPILGEFGGGFGGGMDMGGGDAGGAATGGGGGQFADYGGVDPSLDPELAMALRASAEEARAAEAARVCDVLCSWTDQFRNVHVLLLGRFCCH